MALRHALPGGIVHVDNARFASGKQQALAGKILLHILVLIAADMILGKVCEHARKKGQRIETMIAQADGGSLEHSGGAARIEHTAQRPLDFIRFRRRIDSMNVLFADINADRSDHAGLISGLLENGAHHMGRRCLALCTGNTDDAQMLSRAAEQGGAQLRQGGPGIFHDHKRRAARLYLMLSNHGAAARVHSGFRVAVTVGTGSAQTDERLARPGLTGIVNEIGNLRIEIAGEGIGKIFEQILEFHAGPPYPTFTNIYI